MWEQQVYRVFMLCATILFIVTMTNRIQRDDTEGQLCMESKFPVSEQEKEEASKTIRVLIKNNGFLQITHHQVELESKSGMILEGKEKTIEVLPGERIKIAPDHPLFRDASIRVSPKNEEEKITVCSLKRGYGTPSYRGTMELFATAEGIVLINELSVEEYLCAVVPSEMPANYELEALKAQAVCARSYAYAQMKKYGYPEYQAHVDDSTSYQVYGNSKEQEKANQAVKETCGQCIWYQDQIVKAYYYSTSCGKTTSVQAWGTKESDQNSYLKSVSVCNEKKQDYEASLPWYRWEITIGKEELKNLLELNLGVTLGMLKSISVSKYGPGSVALEVKIQGSEGSALVKTEHKIRAAFGGGTYQIQRQDGKSVAAQKLLPSAFITIQQQGERYLISGGGYGHGIGMSQNGANKMALEGKNHVEILTFFYSGVIIEEA